MNNYSFSEMADMHLVLGECEENGAAAARRYADKFPNRNVPDRRIFLTIDRNLRETGTLKKQVLGNSGRPKDLANADDIIEIVDEHPDTSMRKIAAELRVPRIKVWRTVKEQLLHPFHITEVQELLPEDYAKRMGFCDWLLEDNRRNINFINNILFTDESTFTRNGVTNHHNTHIWADVNPKVKKVRHHQVNFRVNVWAGIIDNYLIGPVFLPNKLNGEHYLSFLQNDLPICLENVPLAIRRKMYFMQDGAPPHFSNAVRAFLFREYPGRWIGRGPDAPIEWPPRGPCFVYGDI